MKAAVLGCSMFAAASWAYVRHVQLPIGPKRSDWGPLVIGHRGCRFVKGVPENTLDAFEYARVNGADGIECDVRMSRDDVPIIHHDAEAGLLFEDTDLKGAINDLDLITIKRLRFKESDVAQVPTLEETILFCRENQLKLLIEIKETKKTRKCMQKINDLYKRYPDYMYTNTICMCFYPQPLYYLREANPKAATGMLHLDFERSVEVQSSIPPILKKYPPLAWSMSFLMTKVAPWVLGCTAMGPHYVLFNEEYRSKWIRRHMTCLVWGVTKENFSPSMLKPGVCVICDDDFDAFRAPKEQPTYASVFPDAPSVAQHRLPTSSK